MTDKNHPDSLRRRRTRALLRWSGLVLLFLSALGCWCAYFLRPSVLESGDAVSASVAALTDLPSTVASEMIDSASPLESAGRRTSRNEDSRAVPILPIRKGNRGVEMVGGPLRGMPVGEEGVNPQHDRGRVVKLDSSRLRGLVELRPRTIVELPSFDDDGTVAEVESRVEDHGWLRFGGVLKGADGKFTLNTNFDQVFGLILMPRLEVALEILTEKSGEVVMVERRLSSVLCSPLPKDSASEIGASGELLAAAAADTGANLKISSGGLVPEISTRPSAKAVVYLDFDGERVLDNSWNGGDLIEAAASSLTPAEVRQVIARVAEDYAPFNINFTTRKIDYENALVGRRMRVIVTPTDTANPGSGGVSYVNSWSRAGSSFSSSIPAWVFNSAVKSVAEAVSHEVGHTLGLSHDGTRFTAYYSGHGGALDNPTSWAPIMGKSYERSLTQWSKGEYPDANNTEDDLAILGKLENGVAFAAMDQSGLAGVMGVEAGSFAFSGVLRDSLIPHRFLFSTRGGSFSASVLPSTELIAYANADLQLQLQSISDSSGAVTIAISDPVDALGGSVNKDLAPGTYCLVVRSAKNGEETAGVYASGYPAYGSLGAYRLSARFSDTSSALLPVWAGVFTASGNVGRAFTLGVEVSEGSVVSTDESALPPGISFETTVQTFDSPTPGGPSLVKKISRFVGTPTKAGSWSVIAKAVNAEGENFCKFSINIEPEPVELAAALGGLSGLKTTGFAPWAGFVVPRADGQEGPAAVSGRVGDNGASSLQFSVNGPGILSFWWKVSSEPRHDGLGLLLNGRGVVDSTTRRLVYLSGESSWEQRKIKLPRGASEVEFRYSKDAALGSGLDRAWVYGIKVGTPPVFSKGLNPVIRLPLGARELDLSASVIGAASYVWRVNGIPLKDSVTPERSVIGSASGTLSISGFKAADVGVYELEAINEFGSVISKVLVNAPLAPEIVQAPVAPLGLRAGQPLILTVQSFGQWPLSYEWFKDGRSVQRGANPSFQVSRANARHAGKYRVVVSNPSGKVSSSEIQVAVETPAAALRR